MTLLHCPYCREAEPQHLRRLTPGRYKFQHAEGSGQSYATMYCLACGMHFTSRSRAVWQIERIADPTAGL